MPSPIAHTTAGYAIYRLIRGRWRGGRRGKLGRGPWLILLTVVFSHLPDLDFPIGILAGDISAYHNNITHSLFFGVVVALLIGAAARLLLGSGFVQWFLIALFCYETHIVMDYYTYTRGIMALWPISMERFHSSTPVFYGLRWSEGWISPSHLRTIAGEAVFAAVVGLALLALTRIGFLATNTEETAGSRRGVDSWQASSD